LGRWQTATNRTAAILRASPGAVTVIHRPLPRRWVCPPCDPMSLQPFGSRIDARHSILDEYRSVRRDQLGRMGIACRLGQALSVHARRGRRGARLRASAAGRLSRWPRDACARKPHWREIGGVHPGHGCGYAGLLGQHGRVAACTAWLSSLRIDAPVGSHGVFGRQGAPRGWRRAR
jgi:hypothetical protein